jgi:hypothetical protein
MAHYALLDENNVVVNVIVGNDEYDISEDVKDWELYYSNLTGMTCKRTSYNTINNKHLLKGIPFRGNYAGLGFFYDESLDCFIPPKTYKSWILDLSIYDWKPPAEYPNDGKSYLWDESSASWKIEKGE